MPFADSDHGSAAQPARAQEVSGEPAPAEQAFRAKIQAEMQARTSPDQLSYRDAVRLLILIPFQDETNNATLSSWQDHEEPMSSWSHPLGRLCSKPRTS